MKETYERDLWKRPMKETYERDLWKRPTDSFAHLRNYLQSQAYTYVYVCVYMSKKSYTYEKRLIKETTPRLLGGVES